jgi:hypothetical protein
MPIPAHPLGYLILVQPHLALGLLKAFLDGPAHPCNSHKLLKGSLSRAKAHVIGQFLWLGDAAAHQQPLAFARLPQWQYRHTGPIIYPGPLGPIPCAKAHPFLWVHLGR